MDNEAELVKLLNVLMVLAALGVGLVFWFMMSL
jgi:hypothetical protein